jgi:hypothetical protein
MDTFALKFDLATDAVGWADAALRVGSTECQTAVSDLTTDPLGSLAHSLIAFIWPQDTTYFLFGKRADLETLRARSFTWHDEPGGWQWTLHPHGPSEVRVRVEQLASQTARVLIVDSICSLQEMASVCADCIEQLLRAHGIAGYHLRWPGGDLPLSYYLLLRRWLESPTYDPRRLTPLSWPEDLAALNAVVSSPVS